MPSIACHTLGCKVNSYDTSAMREAFERAGYTPVSMDADADVYLVNTCTVTGTGDQKSLKLIRKLTREHPRASIIACGCLAQRAPEKLTLPGVKLILGTQNRGGAVELFESALKSGECVTAVEPLKGAPFENLFVSMHEGKTRAVMKIQEGCDRYCAYCVIPYVRGEVRSMELCEVKREACRLARAGYLEIVLTGIHLASYGRGRGYSLIDAVNAVCDAEGVARVRLGSLEPGIITPEFTRAIQAQPKLCPQFHLSLQSGAAGVLKRMGRRYTPDEYMRALNALRRALPGCAITTDVLTGFPGETDAEAAETLDFVKRAQFARIHVFPYSRRSGTAADRMPNQVPEYIKKQRAAQLITLGNKLEAEYVSLLKGVVVSVLFETRRGACAAEGYTPEYVRVCAPGEPGTIARVRVTRAEGALAFGDIAE